MVSLRDDTMEQRVACIKKEDCECDPIQLPSGVHSVKVMDCPEVMCAFKEEESGKSFIQMKTEDSESISGGFDGQNYETLNSFKEEVSSESEINLQVCPSSLNEKTYLEYNEGIQWFSRGHSGTRFPESELAEEIYYSREMEEKSCPTQHETTRFTAKDIVDQLYPEEDFPEELESCEEEESEEEEDHVEPSSEQHSSDDNEEEEEENEGMTEIFMSWNGEMGWSPAPYAREGAGGWAVEDVQRRTPGPTRLAVANTVNLLSAFLLFFPASIERIVIEMSNLEGIRRYGERWKKIDESELRAYLGLLVLAGVYRSQGEAASRLWHPETGRPVFCATMPLKRFCALSAILQFDNRESRAARRATDKLAAFREVWDRWAKKLPLMYHPGPDVTLDERLLAFRGRCPFRQYMPNKPGKCGIKLWVVCDAQSSYAWDIQVCTGRAEGKAAASEKKQSQRIILDMTRGLGGHNVTCDNVFVSCELGQELLKKQITLVGTMQRNKQELPAALTLTRHRKVFSSVFAFTPTTTLVSYIPKKKTNVVLLSTFHKDAQVSDRVDKKPVMILDYNRNKGGVDNLDKVTAMYSCQRKTARWPLALFFKIIDISTFNAFVIWSELNPSWKPSKRNWRRLFLEELGKELVTPFMQRRRCLPHTHLSASLVRAAQNSESGTCDVPQEPRARSRKRRRCNFCPSKSDTKTGRTCCQCKRYICQSHTLEIRSYCFACREYCCR
ncbi:piggyBac transposable element-derived protein 4-like [Erpetoichthys calabaricus]|uniref:piggyBac transposable element-derived protein 4-like n=1 Tax=Erpetoichthys calabaricus TaxID=27687 RepID=UPI0010A0AADA|nr:piggyBac transposable element-derived protein 4-like [Erpetoichthys calabaricus]